MLEARDISAAYGPVQVLRGVSFSLGAGEIMCLLGRNGAGKTTVMKCIMGLLPLSAGQITLGGIALDRLAAHEIPRHGVGYVPQGRRLFSELTVAQNLEVGRLARRSGPEVLDHVLSIFPRLAERLDQRAETLSGGEQQMLAMARALCLEPRLLLLDEPTEGLQPSMIEAIRQVVLDVQAAGVAVLLVEQRVDAVLSVASRVTFVENGQSREAMDIEALRADRSALVRYLGVQ